MSPLAALVSADLVSADPDRTARMLVDSLGLPEPRPAAFAEPPGLGYRAVWMRAHVSMKVSPTLIEVIGGRPATGEHDWIQERVDAQAPRPVRTHATVFAGDVEEVLTRLRRNRVRHRVTPPGPDFDFPRVWLGVSHDEPLAYDPGTDAGLLAEVLPLECSGMPETFVEPWVSAAAAASGSIVRVARRRFLVADLDRARAALERSLGLEAPALADAEARRVVYPFPVAAGAELELAEPLSPDSDLGRFAGRWGPGPHAVVLAVRGLDDFAERLAMRGTPIRRTGSQADGTAGVAIDPAATGGTPFEAVEAALEPPRDLIVNSNSER